MAKSKIPSKTSPISRSKRTRSADDDELADNPIVTRRKTATSTPAKKKKESSPKDVIPDEGDILDCLPRTRETELKSSKSKKISFVFEMDEAGRDSLAGPVVAVAVYCPSDISGIIDSKKITKEQAREDLYDIIVAQPERVWTAAIVDAARIDQINILQATLQGMRMAAEAVLNPPTVDGISCVIEASISQEGCYVVCSNSSGRSGI